MIHTQKRTHSPQTTLPQSTTQQSPRHKKQNPPQLTPTHTQNGRYTPKISKSRRSKTDFRNFCHNTNSTNPGRQLKHPPKSAVSAANEHIRTPHTNNSCHSPTTHFVSPTIPDPNFVKRFISKSLPTRNATKPHSLRHPNDVYIVDADPPIPLPQPNPHPGTAELHPPPSPLPVREITVFLKVPPQSVSIRLFSPLSCTHRLPGKPRYLPSRTCDPHSGTVHELP